MNVCIIGLISSTVNYSLLCVLQMRLSPDDEEVKSLVERINCNTELYHCKDWSYFTAIIPHTYQRITLFVGVSAG